MLPISGLRHFAYCPRSFALVHIEQVWDENHFTAEGRALHQRVDTPEHEERGDIRYERSVALFSHQHDLIGKMDLLEIKTQADRTKNYFPVEYKRGKPKLENWDKVQLCAQALCLEEMLGVEIHEGAIWYWQVRQREHVCIDSALRESTLTKISLAQELMSKGITPSPIKNKSRCRGCSLIEICKPDVMRRDRSFSYVEDIFKE
ncbi:MAG: CRISPR-associated protein Cas4 [Pseudomonadota bacterium]|nr:CRISPR-associated protein Cas4 [Pseudomonadota bacterium]